MKERQEALAAWSELMKKKADTQIFRSGIAGDGSSAATADVDNRPGWAWVRMEGNEDHATQVINWFMPGMPQGLPVMVGKRYPTDRNYQVLGINLDLYYQGMDYSQYIQYLLPRHGDTHTHGQGDPAWIDTGNLIFGRATETTPESLFVNVTTFAYSWMGGRDVFEGDTIDLTDYVPTVSGEHRYVVVVLNPVTNSLEAVGSGATPITVAASIDDIDAGLIPIAAVLLEYGDTEIDEGNIYDYRIFLGVVGEAARVATENSAILEAEMDFLITMHHVNGV